MMWLNASESEALTLSLAVASRSVLFSLPVCNRARVGADAPAIHRPHRARCVRAPAAGAAAGRGGISLIGAVRRPRPVGGWLERALGIELIFTRNGAALATAVMSFPLMVRAMRISLENVDRGLEDAARTLGAGAIDRFASITLPLMLPGVLAGAITAFFGGAGRIRSRHHVCFQHSRRDAHPCRSPCIPRCRLRAATRKRHVWPSSPASWAWVDCCCPSGSRGACGACWAADAESRRQKSSARPLHWMRNSSCRHPGWVALFGRSGCGKTTLVNVIAGLLDPDSGRVALDEAVLLDTGRGVGRAARAAPHRLRFPGCPTVSAFECRGKPALRAEARAGGSVRGSGSGRRSSGSGSAHEPAHA